MPTRRRPDVSLPPQVARRKSVAGKGSEKAKARRRSSVSVPVRYQAAAEALTLVLDRVDGHIAAVEARRDRAQVVLSRNVRGWLARIRHPDVDEIRRCVAGALFNPLPHPPP